MGNKIAFMYLITVKGRVDSRYLPLLGNVSLGENQLDDGIFTTITGAVADQPALSGLLNTLVDHNFTIISVQKLEN